MSPNFQSPCNFVSFFQLSHPRFIVGTLGLVGLFYLGLVELKQEGDL